MKLCRLLGAAFLLLSLWAFMVLREPNHPLNEALTADCPLHMTAYCQTGFQLGIQWLTVAVACIFGETTCTFSLLYYIGYPAYYYHIKALGIPKDSRRVRSFLNRVFGSNEYCFGEHEFSVVGYITGLIRLCGNWPGTFTFLAAISNLPGVCAQNETAPIQGIWPYVFLTLAMLFFKRNPLAGRVIALPNYASALVFFTSVQPTNLELLYDYSTKALAIVVSFYTMYRVLKRVYINYLTGTSKLYTLLGLYWAIALLRFRWWFRFLVLLTLELNGHPVQQKILAVTLIPFYLIWLKHVDIIFIWLIFRVALYARPRLSQITLRTPDVIYFSREARGPVNDMITMLEFGTVSWMLADTSTHTFWYSLFLWFILPWIRGYQVDLYNLFTLLIKEPAAYMVYLATNLRFSRNNLQSYVIRTYRSVAPGVVKMVYLSNHFTLVLRYPFHHAGRPYFPLPPILARWVHRGVFYIQNLPTVVVGAYRGINQGYDVFPSPRKAWSYALFFINQMLLFIIFMTIKAGSTVATGFLVFSYLIYGSYGQEYLYNEMPWTWGAKPNMEGDIVMNTFVLMLFLLMTILALRLKMKVPTVFLGTLAMTGLYIFSESWVLSVVFLSCIVLTSIVHLWNIRAPFPGFVTPLILWLSPYLVSDFIINLFQPWPWRQNAMVCMFLVIMVLSVEYLPSVFLNPTTLITRDTLTGRVLRTEITASLLGRLLLGPTCATLPVLHHLAETHMTALASDPYRASLGFDLRPHALASATIDILNKAQISEVEIDAQSTEMIRSLGIGAPLFSHCVIWHSGAPIANGHTVSTKKGKKIVVNTHTVADIVDGKLVPKKGLEVSYPMLGPKCYPLGVSTVIEDTDITLCDVPSNHLPTANLGKWKEGGDYLWFGFTLDGTPSPFIKRASPLVNGMLVGEASPPGTSGSVLFDPKRNTVVAIQWASNTHYSTTYFVPLLPVSQLTSHEPISIFRAFKPGTTRTSRSEYLEAMSKLINFADIADELVAARSDPKKAEDLVAKLMERRKELISAQKYLSASLLQGKMDMQSEIKQRQPNLLVLEAEIANLSSILEQPYLDGSRAQELQEEIVSLNAVKKTMEAELKSLEATDLNSLRRRFNDLCAERSKLRKEMSYGANHLEIKSKLREISNAMNVVSSMMSELQPSGLPTRLPCQIPRITYPISYREVDGTFVTHLGPDVVLQSAVHPSIDAAVVAQAQAYGHNSKSWKALLCKNHVNKDWAIKALQQLSGTPTSLVHWMKMIFYPQETPSTSCGFCGWESACSQQHEHSESCWKDLKGQLERHLAGCKSNRLDGNRLQVEGLMYAWDGEHVSYRGLKCGNHQQHHKCLINWLEIPPLSDGKRKLWSYHQVNTPGGQLFLNRECVRSINQKLMDLPMADAKVLDNQTTIISSQVPLVESPFEQFTKLIRNELADFRAELTSIKQVRTQSRSRVRSNSPAQPTQRPGLQAWYINHADGCQCHICACTRDKCHCSNSCMWCGGTHQVGICNLAKSRACAECQQSVDIHAYGTGEPKLCCMKTDSCVVCRATSHHSALCPRLNQEARDTNLMKGDILFPWLHLPPIVRGRQRRPLNGQAKPADSAGGGNKS